jgi:hypothetical protein
LSRARCRSDASSAALLPVTVVPAMSATSVAGSEIAGVLSIVELSLPSGARLRIETSALDPAMLGALIGQLQR